MSGDDERLDQLLREGARSLRQAPDPVSARAVLAPLRRARRSAQLRVAAWTTAAAGLLLAVLYFPPRPGTSTTPRPAEEPPIVAETPGSPAKEGGAQEGAENGGPGSGDPGRGNASNASKGGTQQGAAEESVDGSLPLELAPELADELRRLRQDAGTLGEHFQRCIPLFDKLRLLER